MCGSDRRNSRAPPPITRFEYLKRLRRHITLHPPKILFVNQIIIGRNDRSRRMVLL